MNLQTLLSLFLIIVLTLALLNQPSPATSDSRADVRQPDRNPSNLTSGCPQFKAGLKIGTIESALITEASGLAASRKNGGVLWVHNDKGHQPCLFAMNRSGRHLGIYNIAGAANRDWEDIAIGPGPEPGRDYIYIGDIGDNKEVRTLIKIYRIPEPHVLLNQDPINVKLTGMQSITLVYPDGPHDAETLLVDPATRDIYIITKRDARSALYRAPYPQSTTETITLEFKGKLPSSGAVSGDISPTGDMIIVRGYFSASLWLRPAGTNLWDAFDADPYPIPLALEPQGEAVCFDPNTTGYYTVSEGRNQPIYYFAREQKSPAPPFKHQQIHNNNRK